ncbi:MAG: M24 family metallopeptidase [Terracidiphilus sp.]|jgi:antitoxin VapB
MNATDQTQETRASKPIQDEIRIKKQQLVELMAQRSLGGVLLSRHENVAWATAGQVDMRVAVPSATGSAAVFVRKDGSGFYLTTNNEASRMHDEEFGGLGFEPVVLPWQEGDFVKAARRLAAAGALGADTHEAECEAINLAGLRSQLQAAEIERYRSLGAMTARVVEDVVLHLEPGETEEEISALTASRLIQNSILPSVLLMAVDDRILKYKHALPRGKRLQRFGMVNLCARKWGLVISMTRFVHFGPMPQSLADGFEAAAKVNAALLHATRAGVTAQRLYSVAKDAYAAAGFPGAEDLHHQGGATGYGEREWVATPKGTEIVVDRQAFAWNPSCEGGKVEDTVVLRGGAIESLTETTEFPSVVSVVGGQSYRSSGVLLR